METKHTETSRAVTRPCCCSTDNATHEAGCRRGRNEARADAYSSLVEALASCKFDNHHDVNCGIYAGTVKDCDCWVGKTRSILARVRGLDDSEREANAAYIVRAANSFDALADAAAAAYEAGGLPPEITAMLLTALAKVKVTT